MYRDVRVCCLVVRCSVGQNADTAARKESLANAAGAESLMHRRLEESLEGRTGGHGLDVYSSCIIHGEFLLFFFSFLFILHTGAG